jgi:hypothetical protein
MTNDNDKDIKIETGEDEGKDDKIKALIHQTNTNKRALTQFNQ